MFLVDIRSDKIYGDEKNGLEIALYDSLVSN